MFRILTARVQDALAAAIQTRLPAGVAFAVGYPAGGVQDRHVWVIGDFSTALPWYVSGMAQRGEEGQVQVKVISTETTELMTDPRDDALAIAAAVEDAVTADPTLGGLVDEAHVLSIAGQEAIPEERRRQMGLTITVGYTASAAR